MENRTRKMKNHAGVAAKWIVVVTAALILACGAIAQETDGDMSAEEYYLRAKEALRKAAEEDPPGIDKALC